MKTKGFTLVELLAVIVLLSVLLVIAVPSILNSKNNALGAISKQEKENLQDAGNMVGIDLDDPTSDIYNCKSGSWIANYCTKSSEKWTKIDVPVSVLQSNGYFDDKSGKCSGKIRIKPMRDTDTTYRVTFLSGLECD